MNSSLLCLIFLAFLCSKCLIVNGCEGCNKTYSAPGNMKYPYGDENDINADVTSNDTNTIICRDKVAYVPEYGRCPFPPADPNDMELTNPYVKCPGFPPMLHGGQIPHDVPLTSDYVQCKTCDVKLTPDGKAVNLKCIGCYDLPSSERTANFTERELLYTVFYVEIANYTSVEVLGKENFNP